VPALEASTEIELRQSDCTVCSKRNEAEGAQPDQIMGLYSLGN
jgi:hypothetical protein